MLRNLALALLAGLLVLSVPAEAQSSVNASLTLNWTAPTQNTDGTPVASGEITSYEIWVSTTPFAAGAAPAGAPTATVSATTSTTTLSEPAGATVYAVIEACAASGSYAGCSAPTNQVSGVIPSAGLPGVPTNVTIQISIVKGS